MSLGTETCVTWLCVGLVTPHTVVTTERDPACWLVPGCQETGSFRKGPSLLQKDIKSELLSWLAGFRSAFILISVTSRHHWFQKMYRWKSIEFYCDCHMSRVRQTSLHSLVPYHQLSRWKLPTNSQEHVWVVLFSYQTTILQFSCMVHMTQCDVNGKMICCCFQTFCREREHLMECFGSNRKIKTHCQKLREREHNKCANKRRIIKGSEGAITGK